MPFDNIYDLYNQTLLADKPFVASVITQLKSQIETKTAQNIDYLISFNLSTFLLPTVTEYKQVLRIRDQVQFYLRAIGIRCTISPRPFPQTLVSISSDIYLNVSWIIRDNREFMKSYY